MLGWDEAKGEYTLPPLPYAPEALEPHLDAQTMQIHHGKHHASYVTGLNKALAELAKVRSGAGDASLIKHWSRELAFHGGGHINHALFWVTMAPPSQGGGGEPGGALAGAIARDFGSFEGFRKHFSAAAGAVEGSGWAWLVYDRVSQRLLVQQMEKQQNMLLTGAVPLVGVDVWEHAYYLRYQNRRADYVTAFFNVINWARVGSMYEFVVGE
ncbi:MAG TPA: superoxide dismutase [Phycisphaerales bacterium]|nr:superoxide dismutase [Phycisphaerales bacterium]